MTPQEEIDRAAEVKRLMENRYLKQALDEIERAMIEQIVLCPVGKQDLLNELTNILRAKRKFAEILESHIQTGKLAERARAAPPPSMFGRIREAWNG